MSIVIVAPSGILLPESTLGTTWFAVLATFVAVNTIMYAALSVAKILPKLYPRDWLPRHYERAQTRSIHPEVDNVVQLRTQRHDAA